ncbi:MAG TPA: fumarylacetoacetate hydrolase family protein [Novosphingobium sp.]|nr:fumarylacetoacetate hydrolase family protein [Novosphingobium sp.]HZV09261.1 fumarylacetoacetate hydrolase family protein [Novosphingobium sp.]
MALAQETVNLLAERLETARRDRAGIVKITNDHPDLSWADAYVIQDRLRDLQQDLGVAGLKMGFTSRAKMAQMGCKDPINGYLTEAGRIAPGGSVSRGAYIFPRVEAEIAIVTSRELKGPGCTIAQVQAAVAQVLPALEVIDSRYLNYGFDLPSVIADNTSAAAFVVGDRGVPVAGLDLKAMGVVTLRNGEVVNTAAGAAVLGSPLNSVALLANMLGRRGLSIPAGTLILTGGITEAVPINPGDHFTIKFQNLGQIDLSVTE